MNIDTLPNDVCYCIFSFLMDINDFKSLRSVSKNMKKRVCRRNISVLKFDHRTQIKSQSMQFLKILNVENLGLVALAKLPQTLEWLNCSNNMLSCLVNDELACLKWLNCRNNNLRVLPKMPNIQRLYCASNYLTHLKHEMNHLTHLYCTDNALLSIPDFPNLEKLNCASNRLSDLVLSSPKITYIDCSFNHIVKLDIHTNITNLICYKNRLEEIMYLKNLKKLDCSDNNISKIQGLFYPQLVALDCSHNQLTSLPTTPVLEILRCSANLITKLPEHYPLLVYLECNVNNLTKLPDNLPLIREIYCSNNSIQEIKTMLLEKLVCSFNQIEKIDPLPNCVYLSIKGNIISLEQVWNKTFVPKIRKIC